MTGNYDINVFSSTFSLSLTVMVMVSSGWSYDLTIAFHTKEFSVYVNLMLRTVVSFYHCICISIQTLKGIKVTVFNPTNDMVTLSIDS